MLDFQRLLAPGFRPPLNLAHRGASGHAPENTLAAFRLAREMGAHGAELDVRLSADGVPVVFHDADLVRLFGITQAVEAKTAAALGRVSFGRKFGETYAAERIPTLAEALCVLDGLVVNVEIKCDGFSDGRLERATADVIRAQRAGNRVVVSSFNPLSLALFKAAARDVAMAFLFEPDGRAGLRGPWAGYALGARFLNPRKDVVTAERVERWHRDGLGVMTWTANDAATMRRLAACGVDAIITNYPDRLAEVLESP